MVYTLLVLACCSLFITCSPTDIVNHFTLENGIHQLTTATGAAVFAEHVIYAIGYEPEELYGQFIKSSINRTYAIVTEPQSDIKKWYKNHLIWETARPYFYMRTTPDGRVIAGGLDEKKKRIRLRVSKPVMNVPISCVSASRRISPASTLRLPMIGRGRSVNHAIIYLIITSRISLSSTVHLCRKYSD